MIRVKTIHAINGCVLDVYKRRAVRATFLNVSLMSWFVVCCMYDETVWCWWVGLLPFCLFSHFCMFKNEKLCVGRWSVKKPEAWSYDFGGGTKDNETAWCIGRAP